MTKLHPTASVVTHSSASSSLDVQHGVVLNRLWPIKLVDGVPTTILKLFFVDCTDFKKKVVRTTIRRRDRDEEKEKFEQEGDDSGPPSKKPRPSVPSNPFDFVTWEDCANLRFEETTDKEDSNIRITFSGNGFSSAIGTDAEAEECKDDSMMLGRISDQWPPSESVRRHILHEFGHVLGLDHEHQSPAARKSFKLSKSSVKKDCGRRSAKDNILDRIKKNEDLWNYSNFDPESIMIYPIYEHWQKQPDKIKIEYVLKLSKYDQACVTLMYPPDLTDKSTHERFLKALDTVGIDKNTAGEVIQEFTTDSEGDAAERLTRLRDRFYIWNSKRLRMYQRNVGILSGIDLASLRQSSVQQCVEEVMKNKLLRSVIKNIASRTMAQHGIPTNASRQVEVMKLLAVLSMHDDVGQLLSQQTAAFLGNGDGDGHEGSTTATTETLAD